MLIFQRNLLIFNLPIKRYFNKPSPCSGQVHPVSHFSKPHYSNIPTFQHSNWGEAPKLYLWPYLIICLIVTLSYLPTFTGDFIRDDNPLIKNNPYIKKTHSFYSYLTQEDGITNKETAVFEHTGYYRPLINLTYWIDYKLWGMKATGFRTTNLILHILTCFLLYQFLILLLNDRQASFWATLLFALHPINTESVSWIASRNNILVTLFALCSIYFYIIGSRKTNYAAMSFSVLSFTGAIFSKEFGLIILPIFFLYRRFLYRENRGIFQELSSYLPFSLVLVFYFILRSQVTGTLLSPVESGSIWSKFFYAPYLIAFNLRLIFLPFGLHSFVIHYPKTCLSWQAFTGFTCLALLGLIIWGKRKDKVIIFALLSFLIAILPILNIISTSAVTLISMRWLYFPLTFLVIVICCYLKKLIRMNRFLTLSITGLIAIYFGVYSYVLNKELWHDEDTLYRQEVLNFNNLALAGGLAENLLSKKRYLQAEKYFQLAIDLYPRNAKNYINYSALLLETSRPYAALSFLKESKSLNMPCRARAEWYNNMGTAHFNLKKQMEALKYFMKAVRLWPNEPQFWGNLGSAYGSLGDYVNSVSALRRGLDMDPDSVQLRKNLAVAYRRMGDHAQAIKVLEKIPLTRCRRIMEEYKD